jgi:hypothetical protein
LLNLNGAGGALPQARRDYIEQFRYDRLAAKLGRVLDEVASHDR